MTTHPAPTTGSPSPLDTFLGEDNRWTASVIRDLLVHARRPDVISLAGGLPAPELLATERLADSMARILSERGREALQYGLTAGEPELRERLGAATGNHPDNIIVTAGSQQGLDLTVRVFTKPGDVVAIEDPGYLGAIQILKSHEVELAGIPVDADGIDTNALEARLVQGLRPRLCYVNPTHQNPTGALLTTERANHLMRLAQQYHFAIVVDDPYEQLHIGPAPPLSPLLPQNSSMVIRLGSMSKTLSPGLRIGWIAAHPKFIERLALAKQSADLHTSTLNQLVVAHTLEDQVWWQRHLEGLRARYSTRRNALLAATKTHLPNASIQTQQGGFFLWLNLGEELNTSQLLESALEVGVAFVPGSAFAVQKPAGSAIRLSYSLGEPDLFDEAVSRLASVMP